jgi:putative oxidoreductase
MRLGTLAIRGVVGPLFIGHGTQKLFGWFGGHGLEGTAGFFEHGLGLRPGKRHATAAGLSETLGGVLITLGALTPLAAGMITGTMVTAIRKVHASKGPWVAEGGYEYNAGLLAMMVALTEAGPGKPSVDDALFPRLKGTGWAVLQLAAGTIGSVLATSEPLAQPGPEEPEAVEQPPQMEQPSGQAGGETEPRFGRETAHAPSTAG